MGKLVPTPLHAFFNHSDVVAIVDTYKTKLKLDKEVGGVGFWGFCAGMEMFAFLFGMRVCV